MSLQLKNSFNKKLLTKSSKDPNCLVPIFLNPSATWLGSWLMALSKMTLLILFLFLGCSFCILIHRFLFLKLPLDHWCDLQVCSYPLSLIYTCLPKWSHLNLRFLRSNITDTLTVVPISNPDSKSVVTTDTYVCPTGDSAILRSQKSTFLSITLIKPIYP